MKTKLIGIALLAGASLFAQPRVSIGIGVGGYAPRTYAPAYVEPARPPCPGPDYAWVDGYWSHNYGRNSWVAGYWQRQPRYERPRYDSRFDNDHRRDADRSRSFGNSYRNR